MIILKVALAAIGILLYLALVIFFRRYRQWLPYYILGAFGLVLILVFTVKALKGEGWLAFAHLYPLHPFLNTLGIKTEVFYPSQIMVAVPSGFSALSINIECSSLIEFSVLVGLVLFYPVFSPLQKGLLLLLGLQAIYLLNLLRLMIIVTIVHFYGETMVFLGHAIIGRLFFFVGVIALFWYLFTRPSLRVVKERCEGAIT